MTGTAAEKSGKVLKRLALAGTTNQSEDTKFAGGRKLKVLYALSSGQFRLPLKPCLPPKNKLGKRGSSALKRGVRSSTPRKPKSKVLCFYEENAVECAGDVKLLGKTTHYFVPKSKVFPMPPQEHELSDAKNALNEAMKLSKERIEQALRILLGLFVFFIGAGSRNPLVMFIGFAQVILAWPKPLSSRC